MERIVVFTVMTEHIQTEKTGLKHKKVEKKTPRMNVQTLYPM